MPLNPHNPNQRISRLALLATMGVHRGLISFRDANTLCAMNAVINWAFHCPDSPNSRLGMTAAAIVYSLKEAGVSPEDFQHLSDPNA